MSPEFADQFVRWTARVVVACYLLRNCSDYFAYRNGKIIQNAPLSRWFWTIGALLFTLHVGSALALVHNFSHAAAYEHTAERTAAVVGLRWGGGIYINHAFLLFWAIDTAMWWIKGLNSAYRSRPYYWTVQGIFAFMFLNATLIFGPSYWKWFLLGLFLCAALISRLIPNPRVDSWLE